MYRIMYRGIEVQCDLIDEAVGLCDRLGVPWTEAPRKSGRPLGARARALAERDAEIVRLHKSGVLVPSIASQVNLSEARVYQIVQMRTSAEYPPLLTEEAPGE